MNFKLQTRLPLLYSNLQEADYVYRVSVAIEAEDCRQLKSASDQKGTTAQIKTVIGSLLDIETADISEATAFFELGLSSTAAAELIAEINSQFRVDLVLPHLHDIPNILAMATRIQQHIKKDFNAVASSFWLSNRSVDPCL